MHGSWIESSKFVKLLMEKYEISERMAYKKIKKSLENNEILKVTLQNRTVLYGLAEFGAPKTDIEKEISKEIERHKILRLEKKIEEVEIWNRKDPREAHAIIRCILNILDEPYKGQLAKALRQAYAPLEGDREIDKKIRSDPLLGKKLLWEMNNFLIEKLYSILHDLERGLENKIIRNSN